MCGDIGQCLQNGRQCYWQLVGRGATDAVELPTVHKTACQNKELSKNFISGDVDKI